MDLEYYRSVSDPEDGGRSAATPDARSIRDGCICIHIPRKRCEHRLRGDHGERGHGILGPLCVLAIAAADVGLVFVSSPPPAALAAAAAFLSADLSADWIRHRFLFPLVGGLVR